MPKTDPTNLPDHFLQPLYQERLSKAKDNASLQLEQIGNLAEVLKNAEEGVIDISKKLQDMKELSILPQKYDLPQSMREAYESFHAEKKDDILWTASEHLQSLAKLAHSEDTPIWQRVVGKSLSGVLKDIVDVFRYGKIGQFLNLENLSLANPEQAEAAEKKTQSSLEQVNNIEAVLHSTIHQLYRLSQSNVRTLDSELYPADFYDPLEENLKDTKNYLTAPYIPLSIHQLHFPDKDALMGLIF